ncbi:MAG TPA: YciI family protein, partial [Puia sp.]|nr:YciI family protein [Puia sp.]
NRLGIKGSKVVGANNVVSDGPFTEVKEFINGYIIVKGETVEEAVDLAKGCPLVIGDFGRVEIRPLVTPDNNQ